MPVGACRRGHSLDVQRTSKDSGSGRTDFIQSLGVTKQRARACSVRPHGAQEGKVKKLGSGLLKREAEGSGRL